MSSRPSLLDAAAAAARAAHEQGAQTAPPPPPSAAIADGSPRSLGAPLSEGGRSRARLMLIFAVAIGLVFAAGVVLIAVSLYKPLRAQPLPQPMTADDAAPSAQASAEPPPTASSEGPTINAAPPSTGTSRSSSSRDSRPNVPAVPASAAKKGVDAGAVRPTPSTSTANPFLL